MRYRDLVQFEPITDVVQLRWADEATEARRLVETFVISDRMAEQLASVVIPQLQFLTPRDNKGVLVVGNYGTGKSHLMSVVSAVAEHPELAAALTNPRVRGAAAAIAGRFKVVRVEIGAVQGSLRDILLGELEAALTSWDVPFAFPPADAQGLANNKGPLLDAVAAFRERYPEQGILLVVDELLDYLRGRDERRLIGDLGFLRELGEIAAEAPFRFLGGVQETLFDNPRFAFVAEQLRRVRDRFAQVHIAREDIAFVVAHRLLRKNDAQLAWIAEHLRPFTPLYARLAERLDEFARLFPIHPAYVEVFDRITIAEKREALRTFSRAMEAVLDQEVPTDRPGLISYDQYWGVLQDDPSLRTYPEVDEVLQKARVLEGRVVHAYTRPKLQPMALRIVHALAVQRLTTSDITAPLGVTPAELRDGLCLYTDLPEHSADFLLDQVRVALREIMRTVSGQYLSHNEGNDQYYLDVKKDIDFDTEIRVRGDLLGPDQLDGYFFDALRQALNLGPDTYTHGHRIWFDELPWPERQVTRPGYLFFGAPDERSTAQPPRDFYVYVLPPYLERAWGAEERDDEVIFRLTGLDQTFEDRLRRFAGARALQREAAAHRDVYARKADEHLRRLLGWLQEDLAAHLAVTYQGETRPPSAILPRARSTATQTLDEFLRLVAATLLAPHFAETYPAYPAFRRLSRPITDRARGEDAMDAIRAIAGRGKTKLATDVLAGLELLDEDDAIRPERSRYARGILDLLAAKAEGQVVNRGELIETVAGGVDKPVEKDRLFKLEPEWVAVLLVALVYSGEITLTVTGRETLDAGTIERAATMAIETLANFQHFGRPRALPVGVWAAIFEGLGLAPGLIRDEGSREQAVRELVRSVQAEQDRIAGVQAAIARGPTLWGEPIFTDGFRLQGEKGAIVGIVHEGELLTSTEFQAALRGYKHFLEELAKFTTPGKLRNLRLTAADVAEALAQRATAERAERLLALVARLQPLTAYLAEAQANLPADADWSAQATAARRALLDGLRRFAKGQGAPPDGALARELEALQRAYVTTYSALHRDAVLGPDGDARRQRLRQDPRLATLSDLAKINLLNAGELEAWQAAVKRLPACTSFHEGVLATTPTCPGCGFRPAQRSLGKPATDVLRDLDARLDTLLANWRQALRTNLNAAAARQSREHMTPAERAPIESFLAQADGDTNLPPGFVAAATQALRGIAAITLSLDDLYDALAAGGFPCMQQELTRRFEAFVAEQMRGHDARNTRLTVERGREPAEKIIELTARPRADRAAL